MARALLIALLLVTLGCVYAFVAHPWWFPAGASAEAAPVDQEFRIALWVLGGLFVAGQVLLAVFLAKRRSGDSAAGESWAGNWRLEIAWTVAMAAIFFSFHISGGRMWARMTHEHPSPTAVQVEVTGAQFQWYFRYAGADGVLGRTDAQKFARPDEGNPLGIEPSDPAGRDDIVSTSMVVPVGHLVQLELRAQDVIHSLFIPAMRFKQDTVPGMTIHKHFTPTKIGTYEIACTQLCGTGHYRMRAVVRVVSEDEFEKWLKAQENAKE
ncbi:MAG: cytochrome C oxidase subunit II [Acidobacteriia bacterium]|nr:cytochrome C oxidase subunit II [Terriglobia bacterium]